MEWERMGSQPVSAELSEQADALGVTFEHIGLTLGSIAFWDNRAVQHYAVSDYYPHRRILRRVTISGDRPYYEPARESEIEN